ncbi:rCG47843 [Rattus norvegicus]|uniref:RCG47843 n=1 Tax=Rattus norvegicus TaxID=10116 RepID=A6I0L2_RAT|nr:rCG47843 [Rattus norvegicus]
MHECTAPSFEFYFLGKPSTLGCETAFEIWVRQAAQCSCRRGTTLCVHTPFVSKKSTCLKSIC